MSSDGCVTSKLRLAPTRLLSYDGPRTRWTAAGFALAAFPPLQYAQKVDTLGLTEATVSLFVPRFRRELSDSKLNVTESPKLFATEKKSHDIIVLLLEQAKHQQQTVSRHPHKLAT
jgi:hypothetical protein